MPLQINSFSKTRIDHKNETAEDYVEAILRLSGENGEGTVKTVDLVKTFGVSQPTVTKVLHRLVEEGLVCIHPHQYIDLTDVGIEIAQKSLARHKIVVDFLVSIGVSELQAELDAEGIEHHVSEETIGALKQITEKNLR